MDGQPLTAEQAAAAQAAAANGAGGRGGGQAMQEEDPEIKESDRAKWRRRLALDTYVNRLFKGC